MEMIYSVFPFNPIFEGWNFSGEFLGLQIINISLRHGGFLEGVYEIEHDTKTEYEGF
jgi:hypothetical protein